MHVFLKKGPGSIEPEILIDYIASPIDRPDRLFRTKIPVMNVEAKIKANGIQVPSKLLNIAKL